MEISADAVGGALTFHSKGSDDQEIINKNDKSNTKRIFMKIPCGGFHHRE